MTGRAGDDGLNVYELLSLEAEIPDEWRCPTEQRGETEQTGETIQVCPLCQRPHSARRLTAPASGSGKTPRKARARICAPCSAMLFAGLSWTA